MPLAWQARPVPGKAPPHLLRRLPHIVVHKALPLGHHKRARALLGGQLWGEGQVAPRLVQQAVARTSAGGELRQQGRSSASYIAGEAYRHHTGNQDSTLLPGRRQQPPRPATHLLPAHPGGEVVRRAGAVHAHLRAAHNTRMHRLKLQQAWARLHSACDAWQPWTALPGSVPACLPACFLRWPWSRARPPTWHFSCSELMNRRLAWSRLPDPNFMRGALARVDSTVSPAPGGRQRRRQAGGRRVAAGSGRLRRHMLRWHAEVAC